MEFKTNNLHQTNEGMFDTLFAGSSERFAIAAFPNEYGLRVR
jgi:hypothetical protein